MKLKWMILFFAVFMVVAMPACSAPTTSDKCECETNSDCDRNERCSRCMCRAKSSNNNSNNNNVCASGSTQACNCPDGKKGAQACNASGSGWSACICSDGKVCTPGSTQFCNCAGGTQGSQACNATGSGWGTCQCKARPDCTIDEECTGSNETCVNGKCVKSEVGKQCQKMDDCASKACLYKAGQKDFGYCTKTCESFADCPSFWKCEKVENASAKYCKQE